MIAHDDAGDLMSDLSSAELLLMLSSWTENSLIGSSLFFTCHLPLLQIPNTQQPENGWVCQHIQHSKWSWRFSMISYKTRKKEIRCQAQDKIHRWGSCLFAWTKPGSRTLVPWELPRGWRKTWKACGGTQRWNSKGFPREQEEAKVFPGK